ncbi:MAG: carboxypeptidase regulatory-like domain-containing protein, partial [Desulfobacterales bacterium]|nr:carboxypeptidase regulatory-like domain-containing protein [Desulfobacterales bacterium]
NPIPGLAGARIRVQNELVLTEEYNKTTDSLGEAEFNDLPVGRYKYRIQAENHQTKTGRFWVRPGVTASQEVLLDYNLVTVEWEVTETTIEDEYHIVLNAVYETDVPAAVVVIEPVSVTLPDMKAGEVFNGEFTLTNHGMVRADDLTLTMPADDRYFRYEALSGVPDSLQAKQQITVPYRVVCIQPPGAGSEGGGGGIGGFVKWLTAKFTFTCSNKSKSKDKAKACFIINGKSGPASEAKFTPGHIGPKMEIFDKEPEPPVSGIAKAPEQMGGPECGMSLWDFASYYKETYFDPAVRL